MSAKGQITRLRSEARYNQSERGKATRRAYHRSPARKARDRRFLQSEKGKAYQRAKAWRLYRRHRLRKLLAGRLYYQKNRTRILAQATATTARTRAIAESLVTLFPLLPSEQWRKQLAAEILESNSGQTLCWVNADLESLVADYTEAE